MKKKKPFYKRVWFWIVVIIVILAIIGFAGGGSDDDETETSNSATSSEEETDNTESEETAEEVEDIDFLSVLSSYGTFEETTYTGNSDDVVTLENTGSPILLECSYSGEGNFIVYTVDDAGENVGLLVNTIGAYSGIVTDYQNYLDVTMLSVQASGDWSITVKPMDAMEELSNGETYSGDGVYYIDEEELSTIDLTNSGESNFIVYGAYGVASACDLLANEIGEYSGTVIWSEPQSFFIVTSDGDWSISW